MNTQHQDIRPLSHDELETVGGGKATVYYSTGETISFMGVTIAEIYESKDGKQLFSTPDPA